MTKLFSILFAAALAPLAAADDWPHFLGADHDLVWKEQDILTEFPEAGLEVRWRTKIGGGYSGPAIVSDRVFVMDRTTALPTVKTEGNPNFFRSEIAGNERVLCLRESDGEILWTHEYSCPYTTVAPYAIGPRCTPTVDGDLLYALGAEGDFFCLKTADGSVVWEKHFQKDYGAKASNWGWSSHPLVYKHSVITHVGGDGSAVVAFDKTTGAEKWRALTTRDIGYCPPTLHDIDGEPNLVIWHSEALVGLDPETGKQRWSVPFKATYAMSIGAPRYDTDTKTFFITAFSGKSAAVRVARNGEAYETELLWDGDLRNGLGGVMNTPVIKGGKIYGCGQRGEYRCVNLSDGEIVWKETAPSIAVGGKAHYWSHVFTIGHQPSGKYFLANDVGELLTVALEPVGYKELSRTHVIKPTHKVGNAMVVWSQPAFANRCIYWRNDEEILCVSLAKK